MSFMYIFTLFFSGLSFSDSSFNFLGKKDSQRLKKEIGVHQNFTATEDGLTEVKLAIGNLHLLPGEQIRFELRNQECSQILATDSWNVFQPKPKTYLRFHFDRIADSQGKEYCAFIMYSSPFDRKSSTAPRITTEKIEGVQYYVGTEAQENETLYLRSGYQEETLWQNIWRLIERMSQYKPEWIKGTPLLSLISAILLGSFFLCLWIIFKAEEL